MQPHKPRRVSPAEMERRRRLSIPLYDPARWQRRLEAIAALGGTCECCGERGPIFLTFDHINGVANEQGSASKRGDVLIRWMKARAFQVRGIVRLLCLNCHQAVTWTGACPHRPSVPMAAPPPEPSGIVVRRLRPREDSELASAGV